MIRETGERGGNRTTDPSREARISPGITPCKS